MEDRMMRWRQKPNNEENGHVIKEAEVLTGPQNQEMSK
jgi:hypothetical protein